MAFDRAAIEAEIATALKQSEEPQYNSRGAKLSMLDANNHLLAVIATCLLELVEAQRDEKEARRDGLAAAHAIADRLSQVTPTPTQPKPQRHRPCDLREGASLQQDPGGLSLLPPLLGRGAEPMIPIEDCPRFQPVDKKLPWLHEHAEVNGRHYRITRTAPLTQEDFDSAWGSLPSKGMQPISSIVEIVLVLVDPKNLPREELPRCA